MASSKPRPSASTSDALPPDALFEVLLHLPAKELCRLRAVCRSWLALTSDPLFVAAHKSRHTEPLLAVTFRDGDVRGVSIVDLSGDVLRRIPITEAHIEVLPTRCDLVCVTSPSLGIWVLNPATGVTVALPRRRLEELNPQNDLGEGTYAFGKVASTEKYKMLRIVIPLGHGRRLCEVITLDDINHGGWRRKQDPPALVSPGGVMENVVLDGVVHLLTLDLINWEPGCIVSFNLEAEEWMPTLRGPQPVCSLVGEQDSTFRCFDLHRALSIANLNGCLVTVHNVRGVFIDLWFLMDFESSLWVKKYSISVWHDYAYPLLVLGDERIVLFKPKMRSLQSYDPSTNNCTNVLEIEMEDCTSIGIYTGSPLSLQSGCC